MAAHRLKPAEWAARRAALAELKTEWTAATTVATLKTVLVKAFRVIGILPPA